MVRIYDIEKEKLVPKNIPLEFKSLIPERYIDTISFFIESDTAFANLLRHIVINYVNVKCLSFEISSVKTDDIFVILQELYKRIYFHEAVGS